MTASVPLLAGLLLIAACSGLPSFDVNLDLKQQVVATERAFAKTMADRDHAAFVAFIDDEAIFISGANTLRGKAQVSERWRRHFLDARAPFSWEPDQVEILPSGDLALSTGPVRDPDGKLIGRFTSIWRRGAQNSWRIVFDQGN